MDKKRINIKFMLLKLENISFGYTKNKILSDLSFSIDKGQLVGIVGESGCGKTTLLRIISLLEKPQKGNLYYDGKKIELNNRIDLFNYKSKIGFIFQELNLWPHLKVIENIMLPLLLVKKMNKVNAVNIAFDILEKVELLEFKNNLPSQLSLGQKQRCAIARTLCFNPEIVLCDEITSALDLSLKERIMQLMVNTMKEKNTAGIFISHDVSILEKYCKTISNLKNGKIS